MVLLLSLEAPLSLNPFSAGIVVLLALPSLAAPQKPLAAKNQELLLVSYAVTRGAYDQIIPAFVADWKQKTGQTLRFKTSFGGSGSQTRAVIDGLDADVVNLALGADLLKLEQAGLVKAGWEAKLPYQAIVTNSVVSFFVRPGNPKKLKGWADLDNKNVQVITANPKTSGGARWNFLGLWGSVVKSGGTEQQAKTYVINVYRNVDALPRDAREATDMFVKRGQGDVLLNYENEAILAKKSGIWSAPIIVPSPNILIEAPVAVVDKNVDRKGNRRVAEAFARYLSGAQAQRIFAKQGFRPVAPQVKAETKGQFQAVAKLFTAKDFGGWSKINKIFFANGALWDQIFAKSK